MRKRNNASLVDKKKSLNPKKTFAKQLFSLLEKLCASLYYWHWAVWTMRPAWLFHRGESPWVFFHNRNERLTRCHDQRGVLCAWEWPAILRAVAFSPSLGTVLLRRALKDWPIRFSDRPLVNQAPAQLSFIIPLRGRDRLDNALSAIRSIAAQTAVSVECVIVEQSWQPELKESLPAWVRYIHTPISHPQMPFNRAWALNAGARVATGQLLVFHDADLCAPQSYGQELFHLLSRGYRAMRIARFIFHLNEMSSREVAEQKILPRRPEVMLVHQNCRGGSLAVERQTFFALGGFDEAFVGWGGEDTEFYDRCGRVPFFQSMYLPFVHLYHLPQTVCDLYQQLLDERLKLSASQRIAELSARQFGASERPDPAYAPAEN